MSLQIHRLFSCFLLVFAIGIGSQSLAQDTETDARMLVNLMDYIAKDYAMGVENGEVISEFEFAEMQEFSASAITYADKISTSSESVDSAALSEQIRNLQLLIADTSEASDVAFLADEIKASILVLNLFALSPTKWPNLEKGRALFAAECATCHGKFGDGKGPAGVGLNPAPTNFTDKSIMKGVAPIQGFNIIRLGIPGTGMRSFKELSDDDVWDLAFYIASIQHQDKRSEKAVQEIALSELAQLSDEELIKKHGNVNLAGQRNNPIKSLAIENSPTDIARKLLLESASAYKNEDYDKATNFALNAYLKGVEPIEPQIMASDNALFQRLESTMMNVRAVIKAKSSTAELDKAIQVAVDALDEADEVLGEGSRSLGMTAFIAFGIMIREGLEAFFVILAILGILKSVEAPKAIRWVHGGWITAVVTGFIGWFFADALMQWSPASRELMEGLIALFAVFVLLYLGFWLHGKTEASKWKEFVETRIHNLVNQNNMIGLGAFSFVVVFREAFESVIFLSSLTSDAQIESKIGVLIGFILAAIAIFGLAWAILKWFKRLPISKVFLYSSMVVLALAFILTGQGIHAIQEGGFLAIRSFPLNLRMSTLGLYPTYETILGQLTILIAIFVLWFWNKRRA